MRNRVFGLVVAAALVPAALASAQVTTFIANMDQAQETPTPTPTGATGTGTFMYDASTRQITYSVTVTGVGSAVNAGHIHAGTWGVAGAVNFPLTQTGPTTFSGVTPALTAPPTPNDQVTKLFNEGFYCNVHTMLNSGGELRGQIILQSVLDARKGNVNTGPGGVNPSVDVLTVGGSIGHPIYRELTRAAGATTIAISTPPAGGNRLYGGWIFTGRSTGATLHNALIADGLGGSESLGTAVFCLPSENQLMPGLCPCPAVPFAAGFTSKALGAGGAAGVCLHAQPADPRTPVSLNVNFPAHNTYTVAFLIFDPNASTTGNRKVSLTNTVTVVVP
ncbi:MAG: CHRD domain-containing protein [Planctomycetes bacterium]|nr:CHRD domain-containing protein [Planctomycetota bacterium]MBI3843160.1 CHRD domain-containing protein [Planctomycetota bacterium]